MVVVATYYFPECPLASECTTQAWHRIKKCGSGSLEEAKGKLVHHLTKSSLHWLKKDEAEEEADNCCHEVHETDVEDESDGSDGRAAKRRRPTTPPMRPSRAAIEAPAAQPL